MPLSLSAVDPVTGVLSVREWSLRGEMDPQDFCARFTASGITTGFRHTCSIKLDNYRAADEFADVYDRLSLFFAKRDNIKGPYYVNANMNGYIGVYFASALDQDKFICDMGRGMPEPESALHFDVIKDAFALNEAVALARVRAGIGGVFAKTVKGKPEVKGPEMSADMTVASFAASPVDDAPKAKQVFRVPAGSVRSNPLTPV